MLVATYTYTLLFIGKMEPKPGVVSTLVSLEHNNARVVYEPTVTDPQQICQHINDISTKFTASLPMQGMSRTSRGQCVH